MNVVTVSWSGLCTCSTVTLKDSETRASLTVLGAATLLSEGHWAATQGGHSNISMQMMSRLAYSHKVGFST